MARIHSVQFTDYDLNFIVDTAAPGAADREGLKSLLRDDEAFRKAMVGDARVFKKVMSDEETLIRISPGLYFEVLLRQAATELQSAPFTMERSGSQSVAVFDAKEVASLLAMEPVLDYLAAMLASFTRINSYTGVERVKPNVWRRYRVNDMDIDSLIRLCAGADEDSLIRYYKRIADVCLFILGIFPEHAPFDYRYPASGAVRPLAFGRTRRGVQEYEDEGRRFYKLAGEHPIARTTEMAGVFHLLHEQFSAARKPLAFISAHYLQYRRESAFQGS
ncbi:MAG: hypothetical protein HW397_84 [Dehalococcoidia bacterium]|nr:hypothetical protein [Dehalococcoidia bacterium]